MADRIAGRHKLRVKQRRRVVEYALEQGIKPAAHISGWHGGRCGLGYAGGTPAARRGWYRNIRQHGSGGFQRPPASSFGSRVWTTGMARRVRKSG